MDKIKNKKVVVTQNILDALMDFVCNRDKLINNGVITRKFENMDLSDYNNLQALIDQILRDMATSIETEPPDFFVIIEDMLG